MNKLICAIIIFWVLFGTIILINEIYQLSSDCSSDTELLNMLKDKDVLMYVKIKGFMSNGINGIELVHIRDYYQKKQILLKFSSIEQEN